MTGTKVLYVSQEITPYLPETEMSVIGRNLPQAIQEKGQGNTDIYAKIRLYQ